MTTKIGATICRSETNCGKDTASQRNTRLQMITEAATPERSASKPAATAAALRKALNIRVLSRLLRRPPRRFPGNNSMSGGHA